jgi:hypothetical protein
MILNDLFVRLVEGETVSSEGNGQETGVALTPFPPVGTHLQPDVIFIRSCTRPIADQEGAA